MDGNKKIECCWQWWGIKMKGTKGFEKNQGKQRSTKGGQLGE
jgi:hypothetical protein